MKRRTLGLIGLLLAVGSGAAHSQTAWLLESRANRFAVVRIRGHAVRDIVIFRDTMPIYGESRRAVVMVADGFAHVVDKETATVTSFQLAAQAEFIGDPVHDLSGPLRNVLVTDEHAFFPTIRFAGLVPQNELGGQYDVVQMSLIDGSLRSIPLPGDCISPRLAEIGGVPVVYTPSRDKAWRLAPANGRVEGILMGADVADLRTNDALVVAQGAIPRSGYTADDGSVFYIDGATGAVARLSQKDGRSTSWQLPPGQRDSARILSIDVGR